MKNLFPLLAVSVLIVGCATGYQHNSFTGGFTDMRLAPDIFRITFRGNAYTAAERAQDFALLRASELVLQNRFTHFALLDERQSSTPFVWSTPSTATTTSSGGGETTGTLYGNQFRGYTYLSAQSTTTYTPGQTFIMFKPTSGLLIRAFPEKPNNIPVFEAAFLRDQISSRYKLRNPQSESTPKPQLESAKPSAKPGEGKYVVWKDYIGQQKTWPVTAQAFVSRIEDFPVYGLDEFPSAPYEVVGMIEAGTMLGVEPLEEVLKEAVQFAKQHGAVAILEMTNQPIPNSKGPTMFFHQWHAIRFVNAPTTRDSPPVHP